MIQITVICNSLKSPIELINEAGLLLYQASQ